MDLAGFESRQYPALPSSVLTELRYQFIKLDARLHDHTHLVDCLMGFDAISHGGGADRIGTCRLAGAPVPVRNIGGDTGGSNFARSCLAYRNDLIRIGCAFSRCVPENHFTGRPIDAS